MATLKRFVVTVSVVVEAIDISAAVSKAGDVVRFNDLGKDLDLQLGQFTVQPMEEKK